VQVGFMNSSEKNYHFKYAKEELGRQNVAKERQSVISTFR